MCQSNCKNKIYFKLNSYKLIKLLAERLQHFSSLSAFIANNRRPKLGDVRNNSAKKKIGKK